MLRNVPQAALNTRVSESVAGNRRLFSLTELGVTAGEGTSSKPQAATNTIPSESGTEKTVLVVTAGEGTSSKMQEENHRQVRSH